MAKIKFSDRQRLEDVLGMESGYVLDFSDRTFGEFVMESVDVDPFQEKYEENGTSKANRLRSLWEHESDHTIAKLMTEMLEYGHDRGSLTEEQMEIGRAVIRKLGEHPTNIALKYPAEWRYEGTPAIALPPALVNELFAQAIKMTGGVEDKQEVLEIFKQELASVSGSSAGYSTSYNWAETDLRRVMEEASSNGATFLDAFWSAMLRLKKEGVSAPPESVLNKLVVAHGVGLSIDPPFLVEAQVDATIEPQGSEPRDPGTTSRYVLHERLGQGGNGTVYRATRATSLATFEYALKLLDPLALRGRQGEGHEALSPGGEVTSGDPTSRPRALPGRRNRLTRPAIRGHADYPRRQFA